VTVIVIRWPTSYFRLSFDMTRLTRLVVPGLPHHMTQRGNRRETVFLNDADGLAGDQRCVPGQAVSLRNLVPEAAVPVSLRLYRGQGLPALRGISPG